LFNAFPSSAFVAVAAMLVLTCPAIVSAQAVAPHPKLLKPDLHAGGVNPSSIPNDATTDVTLPGFHLAGAHIATGAQCSLAAPPIVSDNEIKMKLKGTRKVEDNEDKCDLIVHTAGGTASTWIVVELTEDQQQVQTAREKSEEQSKAEAFIAKSGKSWHLKFAGGASETYTATGENQDAMPTFQKSAGASVRIAVSNDNTVLILDSSCMRSGKLVGTEVKDGKSQGDCTPAGSWTATVVP
jgi:hypothetical protein